ncbi:hypothetical protein [Flavobacterium silvisoli]|uniref:hypothetical protein n=1 Tax=Flavobacterium silvisoli TaxID=2529433 RepID=UPI00195B5667|nr:hypothetical protein [Flavobacterium silvisoli]
MSFYNIAISVLSIIFSLFFAALAIIMSSSDNDFVSFLDEDGTFTYLMWTFKAVLISLFISLVYSIVLYTGTSYYIETKDPQIWLQHKSLFISLVLLFTYCMIATGLSVKHTIKFSEYRSTFLRIKRKEEQAKKTTQNN